jgi:predicted nucleotidyltransferase
MVRNRDDIVKFLQMHKEELKQRFGVESLGLYGSYARDEAREDSNIDIAIELASGSKSLSNFTGVRNYLEEQLGKTVNLVFESNLKPVNPWVRDTATKEIIHI